MRKFIWFMLILLIVSSSTLAQIHGRVLNKNFYTWQSESIPILKVTLVNGTTVNFTTVDDFLTDVYSGDLSYNLIENVTVMTIDDYEDALQSGNESLSSLYHSALQMFYVKFSEQPKNYSGELIPVNVSTLMYDSRISEKISKTLAYGRIPSFLVEYFRDNNSEEKQFIDSGYDLIVVIYAKLDTNETVQSLLDFSDKIADNIEHGRIARILVNIGNETVYSFNVSINSPDIYITNDINTSVLPESLGSYSIFLGTNTSFALPLIVIFDTSGIVWYKNLGIPSTDELAEYINLYLKDGLRSIPVYPILDISAEEPKAGRPCKILIIVGEGFGEIYNITLSYRVLDGKNNTLYKASRVKVSVDTYSYVIQKLDDKARFLVVNATIYSKYGSYSSRQYVFRVLYEEKQGPTIPSWVYEAILWLVVIIILLIISLYVYRKYIREE